MRHDYVRGRSPRTKRYSMPPTKCPVCGIEFVPRDRIQKACSFRCGRKLASINRKKKGPFNPYEQNVSTMTIKLLALPEEKRRKAILKILGAKT